MKTPELAERIVKAVVDAVDIPVTVKMRTGWDSDCINAPELAKRCENAGASMITVHGRTRKQMYSPGIDYKTIFDVKKAVSVPVVANGDVCDGESAKYMLDTTGCDYLMVGRAAQGNPFVFEEINAFLSGKKYTPPTLEEKFAVLLEQVNLMQKYKPERVAILESRKHTAWYMTGLHGAANIRRMCGEISSIDDIKRIIEFALEQNKDL
jgi:nifR3 family TIM-barrel protein